MGDWVSTIEQLDDKLEVFLSTNSWGGVNY